MDDRPYLSCAVLAYNEEESIERAARVCSEVLEACGRSYELVLVDDGSTDRTPALMNTLVAELPRCRIVRHPRNLGFGAGIRTCYFATRGEWATWFPADLQADPRELPRLLPLLERCDVLATYRDPKRRHEGSRRKLVSATERMLARILFRVRLRDLHWIRFFRRDVLDRLRPTADSAFIDTEMIVQAKRLGARIREAPLDDHARELGTAKGGGLRHLFGSVRDLGMLFLRGLCRPTTGTPSLGGSARLTATKPQQGGHA